MGSPLAMLGSSSIILKGQWVCTWKWKWKAKVSFDILSLWNHPFFILACHTVLMRTWLSFNFYWNQFSKLIHNFCLFTLWCSRHHHHHQHHHQRCELTAEHCEGQGARGPRGGEVGDGRGWRGQRERHSHVRYHSWISEVMMVMVLVMVMVMVMMMVMSTRS